MPPPSVPPAPIPATALQDLKNARVLTDRDVALLAAQATFEKPGINLNGANLTLANLPGITLNRPDLYKTLIPGATFDGGTITGAYAGTSREVVELLNASLASLQQVGFGDLFFEASTFDHANFNGADILANNCWQFCNLDWTTWVDSIFQGSPPVSKITFADCTFRGAVFNRWKIELDDASRPLVFVRCDFTGARFINCPTAGVVFNHCVMP